MGWARYRSGLLLVTLAPILLLVFLFSLSPELNDSSSSGECTDYLGGCFVSSDNAAPADSPPAEEFQDVGEYLNESEGSPDSESETEVLPEENNTEELPEPEPAPPEQNETGEFQEVDNYLNETTSDEPANETTDEFVDVDELLNETSVPEENETGGFFSNETFSDLFSTNETETLENETTVLENETILINETIELNETVLLNETLLNDTIPEGDAIIGDLIYGKGGRPIKAEVKLKPQGKSSEVYKKEKGEEKFHVPKGKYTLTITPENQPISEITIKNFNIEEDLSGLVSLDEPDENSVAGPPGTRFREVYVFNPHANISGTFTVRATASQVYKCKDWNFDMRACEGQWVNILNVTPGEYYSVDFDSADPAYGEGGSYFTLANITLDGNFDDWDAVFANPHNTMYDGTSGIDDLDTVGTPNRDITRYAFTWNDQYFYSYFRRTSAGTNVAQMLLYIDVKNDNLLGTDDYVVKYSWQNNQDVDVYLYNYTPAIGGGDPITGDGQDENGSISNQVTLETLLPGRGPEGIRMESRLNWSVIGLAPGQPFGLHVSTAQGVGTNLPSQLEDNMNGLSTLAVEVDISPDRTGAGDNGMTIDYNHTVTNLGNQNDSISISTSGTTPGFIVNITYANGTPLSDTNGDSLDDVGPLAPGASENITLHLTIIGASSGDIDQTYVTATSANKTEISDSAIDTTYIGELVIFPDRSGSIFNGSRIYYNHTVLSNMAGSNVVAINATSDNGYAVNLTYLNGTPLTDTDSDGKIDVGNLTQGESKTILVWITIPGAATIGTVDDTTVTALKATNSSVNATINDITTVSRAVTIFPNRSGYISVGANAFIFYEHIVTNNQNFSDVIGLAYNSSLNWNVSFYDSDMLTPLTDTDGDGRIDVGNLSAFGGVKTIYVKVARSGSVSNGTTDITNVTANSSVYSWARDQITETTIARMLITYEDAFHIIFSENFNKTQTVYANSYGLNSYSNVYYMWYDSAGALRRQSPSLAVDVLYEAQDKLALNGTFPSGRYFVYIRDSGDNSIIAISEFNVFGTLGLYLISPAGGEIWKGNETIIYNITDISGNNVTATIQYSPDGGANWFNLSTSQYNTSACSFDPFQQCVEGVFNYTWDTTSVSDGANYLVRILANDTITAESDQSSAFIIDNAGLYEPNDAIMVYRSNTGACAANLLNCPKIKNWDASGNGTWGAEMELPTAGSPVRWAIIKRSPVSDKAVIVTLSDDGRLDGYVCMEKCTNLTSWNATNNIGAVGPTPAQRRFDLEFETSTGNLVLVYGVNSTSTSQDLAYKVLPANASNFSGLTEQYIDDGGHGTNIQYAWVRVDRKPTVSNEILLVGFDLTDSDINAWVWNGTGWGSQAEISSATTDPGTYESLAVRYSYDGTKGMAIGGNDTAGNVDARFWNGTAWSATTVFVATTGNRDVRWANLKADPSSDDLQLVVVDSGPRMGTAYWNGSTWALTLDIDAATDPSATRIADFEWNVSGSTGQLVWDSDGAGTTISQRNCTPRCNGTTGTISGYAGTGAWITMYRNPGGIGTVKILSARLNNAFDIGSFRYNGSGYGNYGAANITADTTVSTFEAYSIAFKINERAPPVINFTYPTPDNGTVIYVNYTFINTTITDDLNVSIVYLEWNGTNESMNLSGTSNWFKNITNLTPGVYTYRVWASDISGNWAVTELRTLVYGSPPLVFVINPLGEAYGQHRPVPLVINATDPDGINFTSATVTYPNGSTQNITLYSPFTGDNFNINTMGINWITEETAVGPLQTCIANIDTTIPGEAYVSLSGDGTPLTDTLCTIISKSTVYGDFDMNISFQLRGVSGPDAALNFQLTETQTSADAARAVFISLSNWTGLGKQYEVFADDGNFSGYLSNRSTNDSIGRFRIKRVNDTFTFYTWNSNTSSWITESSANLSMSRALYISFEAESAYSGWGAINASFNDLQISSVPYYQNIFTDTVALGLYNVTFYARDTPGAVNNSEKGNFTVIPVNDRPSVPFLLAPAVGSTIYGLYNITWVDVTDEENDNVWFNITLLNGDGSFNSTLVSNYGNLNTTQFEWNTSNHADGNYSLFIVVFENDTLERLSNNYTLPGIFYINNTPNQPPSVVALSPLGEEYPQRKPVSLAINATDPDGINLTYALVTHPNGTVSNITLYQCRGGDDFSFDSVGIGWAVENSSIGPSQTCIADINTTIPGKAYTSLSGNGAPGSDTLCSLVSHNAIYGDFDMNVSFEILDSSGTDNAINFQVMELSTSANASLLAFIALSNWTGLGRNYEVFADDGTISEYTATVPTDDTYGKMRIRREGSNFSFYVWNNSDSSWIELDSTELNLSSSLFVAIESESAYSEWGTMEASWDNLSIAHMENVYFNIFNGEVHPIGLYNVSFYAIDNRGAINDSEKGNFTLVQTNNPPSKPFLLAPTPGGAISGLYNITWSGVSDPDGDSLWFNITLLNPDGTDNATITFDYGNASSIQYLWNTLAFPDGEYSMRITVFENETPEHLQNSYTLPGTFYINNILPSVIVLNPLGEDYPQNKPLSISINATDPNGIASAIAIITLPNGSVENLTLGHGQQSDNFDNDTIDINWFKEDISIGGGQTCIADIDTTILGKAYTSLSGDGSPMTDTFCSLIAEDGIDGDFDMQIDFNIEEETGVDYALNFQITPSPASADATKMIFIALSNWTGYGKNYEIFVDDGNFSGYILTRPTDDTSGKMRIKREGGNFTFYTWNNTDSSWIEENVSQNEFNFSRGVYASFESESAYPGWGNISVSWDNFTLTGINSTFAMFNSTSQLGLYNVSFIVYDIYGGVNDTETTNFTVSYINTPPSTPFLLAPAPGDFINGTFDIVWSAVHDDEGDNVWFNITLLNPDGSYNATIVSNYGNISSNNYFWNTLPYPDGVYSMNITVFENETPEQLSNFYTMVGNFTIDHSPPLIQFEYPTDNSTSVLNRNYILVNVSAYDPILNVVIIRLYNASGDLINESFSSTSPFFLNFTGLPEGLYYFNATALDNLGHENSTETRNVTIETAGCVGATSTFTCGEVVNESCTLNIDLFTNGTCLTVTSENVSIDCSSHTISGNGSGEGILVQNTRGFDLRHCRITTFNGSLTLLSVNDSFFQNNTLWNSTYGLYMDPSYNNTIIEHNIYNNSVYGLYLENSHNNTIRNNGAYNNSEGGIYLDSSSSNSLSNNTAFNNPGHGIALDNSLNNNLTNNTVSDNAGNGLYILGSAGSILLGNNAFNNTEAGAHITDSTTILISGDHYHSNGREFLINTSASALTYNLSGVIFDSPAGNYTNYTNLSINDVLEASASGRSFQIKWSMQPAALPAGIENFHYKYLNITNLTNSVSIDYISWSWTDAELSGYNESKLEIWRYNSTWALLNYTSDPSNNRISLYNLNPASEYGLLSDQAGPDIIWINQTPADISSSNVFGNPLLINYNITDPSGVNLSSVLMHYKTNSSTSDCLSYVNGTATPCGWQSTTYVNNTNDTFLFRFFDNQVYPATYNFPERPMETTIHSAYNLANPNYMLKIELLNVSNAKQYGMFEIMANTTGTRDLTFYYCNSSYVSGTVFTSPYCTSFYTLTDGIPYNHSHSNYSSHHVIPFSVNTTSGMLGGVYVTSTSYFIVRPTLIGSGSWNVYYISNVSRANATQTSTNVGNAWSELAGTADSHLHQYEGSDAFRYYVCALDNVSNYNCSSEMFDYINLTGIPPTAPNVYSPTNTTYCGDITIAYTQSLSPNGYNMSHYNISLLNSTGGFNKTIIGNNSLNLSYEWNTNETSPGNYTIRVEACDVLNQCSFGYSEEFNFTGPCEGNCPIITSPGAYSMNFNFVGAPNPVSGTSPITNACVVILSSNVSFSCNGYSITNNGTSNATAILVDRTSGNVTVENCPGLSSYYFGLYGYLDNYTVVRNSTALNNTAGFRFWQSTGISIYNNTAHSNSLNGIQGGGVDYSTIANNTAFNNLQRGFTFGTASSFNNFTGNSAYNNSENGILFGPGGTGNNILNNSIFNNSQMGISLYLMGDSNVVANNTVFNNVWSGIYSTSSSNNTISENRAYNNSQYGIYIYNSTNNTLSNNAAYLNLDGVVLESSSANTLMGNTAYNNSNHGFRLSGTSQFNNLLNNTAYWNLQNGFYLNAVANNSFTNNSAYANADGFYLNGASFNNLSGNNASNQSYGFYMVSSNNNSISAGYAYNNSVHGFYLSSSSNNNLASNSAYNNSISGMNMAGSQNNTLNGNNITMNTLQGIALSSDSPNNTLSSNYVCFNDNMDIANNAENNSGTGDSCDNYLSWNESGHEGCTFRCTDVWHRFYGQVNGSLLLAPNNVDMFYTWAWNGQNGKLYALNGDAVIEWINLTALGRNTSGGNSTNDFTELDSLLGISAEPDNINATYSYDGSNPKQTQDLDLFEHLVQYVPEANSSVFTSGFTTGIAWDASQGGTQFNTTLNQDVVFVSQINGTAPNDYEIMVPGTLDTYKGGSGVVEFWVELD